MAREQQAAAGIAIEPMHQLNVIVRAQQAHRVNDAEGDVGTGMNGQPGRFVDHQQMRVLIDNGSLQFGQQTFRRSRRIRASAVSTSSGGMRT